MNRALRFFRAKVAAVFLSLAMIALVGAVPGWAASEPSVQRVQDDREERRALPVETRIAIELTATGVVAAVSLFFPDSGYAVRDWGEPMRVGQRFHVNVVAVKTAEEVVLPVVTEFRQRYSLGALPPGEYGFAVHSGTHLLAVRTFQVGPPPADPAPPVRAHLAVQVTGGHTVAEVRVFFDEPGYRMAEWGEVERHGSHFLLRARAERDPANDSGLVEAREKFLLGDALPPGEYTVAFRLNGHLLARRPFVVAGAQPGSVELTVSPLTEPGQTSHSLVLTYRHPAGLDLSTLGHRNLAIRGPDGFHALAHFIGVLHHAVTDGVTAEYEVIAPGRVWDSRANGLYEVFLLPEGVRTGAGSFFPAQRLGSFEVKIPHEDYPLPAGAEIQIVGGTNHHPGYGARVTLVLPASNVVSSWGQVQRQGNRFAVDVKLALAGDGGATVIREETHVYPLGVLEPGIYAFSVFSRGHLVERTEFKVGEVREPPRAVVIAPPLTEAGDDAYLFQVRYGSPAGMDEDSVRTAPLRVAGPHEFDQEARLLSLETYTRDDLPGEWLAGIYAVAAPEGGWSFRHNGPYQVIAPADAIFDRLGRALPGSRIGGFHVGIRPPAPPPERPRIEFAIREEEGGVYADLAFNPGSTGWAVAAWGDLEVRGHGFAVQVKLAEAPPPAAAPIPIRVYRLGELPPGVYSFVVYSHEPPFLSRHPFVIGESPTDPLVQWRAAVDAARGEAAGDGLSLRHYAFGLEAGEADRGSLLQGTVASEGGTQRLTIAFPVVPTAIDLHYRIEASRDMRNWIDVTDRSVIVCHRERRDGAVVREVRLPEPEDGGEPYAFARVRAGMRE